MTKWKRNIDEPYKKEIIADLHRLSYDDKKAVLEDIATDAVARCLADVYEKLGLLDGNVQDLTIVAAMISERTIIGALGIVAEQSKQGIRPEFLALYMAMIKGLPNEIQKFIAETVPKLRERGGHT